MKKDLIFAPAMLLIAIALFLLKATGLAAHMVVAFLGVLVLGAYTSATRKSWKIPALEILMRAFYGIALITGVVLMNVQGVAVLAVCHKVCAALFTLLLVALFVSKLVANKKK